MEMDHAGGVAASLVGCRRNVGNVGLESLFILVVVYVRVTIKLLWTFNLFLSRRQVLSDVMMTTVQ